MDARRSIGWGLAGVVLLALAVILAWPAPNPLADARTVYLQLPGGDPARGRGEAIEGLRLVLDDRDLVLVDERNEADVALELRDIRVDLGDVEFSLAEGRFSGRVIAECRVTDLDTGQRFVMDLVVRIDGEGVRASLRGRRFWEVWK
jgi:hypothetical protein